ncbi:MULTISPECIES: ABC transporter permease [unclassified Arthrobacter]|uniref:ABC transporter permease n=1 Tax=unclassified Arthrobacter TaxID=235627 RepID=UPI001D1437A5|nr:MULTISPECIES: ABC transporter permease [unclassified Arthrobacter]MCC3291212.1 ABC transporter permease [Arthrobacter sp. zg-Y1110]MCC3301386.1 ABC transporter permease [Arthrobacter sp. zg-Y895]UWX83641.1 ABC transporter permease [Arthrobacter sp. zg-Y1110]
MFLALRELRFARARFGLMGGVVALIAVLMVLLSGLSSGLVNDGVSGLKAMPATAFAFNEGTKTDNAFSRSVVDEHQAAVWAGQPGVEEAALMGTAMMNGTTGTGTQVDLALFGIEPGSFLAPKVGEGRSIAAPNEIVVSATAAEEGLHIGDVVTLERIGVELTVVGYTDGQATFGHVNVGYLPLDTWQYLASGQSTPGAPTADTVSGVDFDTASTVALKAADGADLDFAAGDEAAGTVTSTLAESFNASPGYSAETMTLEMIQIFLYAICALVVGAFFTVWTIQRKHELAVLRAVGASTGYLLRDGLLQAAIILVTSTVVGILAGLAMGAGLSGTAMPFALEATPILTATMLTIVLGLAGAALAIVRISRVDPLAALGGQR